MILKKKIIAIIPYRGIGDLIFHVPFLKGIYSKYKSELIIFTETSISQLTGNTIGDFQLQPITTDFLLLLA